MALQSWRWWQWLAVSILIGGLMGFVMTSQDVDDPSIPSVSPSEFIRKLQFRRENGEPVVTDIRVSPPLKDVAGRVMNAVTFWEMQKHKTTGEWAKVRQWRFYAPTPLYARAPRADYSIVDFLAEKKKEIPSLDYGMRWWQVPRNMYLICFGSSILIIGVLWPMLMRALVKAGLGAPEAKDDGFDLSKVRSTGEAPGIAQRPGATQADRDQLSALNATLESNVAGMAIAAADSGDGAVDAKAEEAIRDLPNAPLEAPVAVAAAKPSDEDYKGEYYPVARPIVKK